MKPTHVLGFNVFELAQGLGLREEDVFEMFADGRRSSWVMERRIARAEGFTPAPEGAEYDLVDPLFRRWEVRSLSRRGMHFGPSSMFGTGREFTVSGFLSRLCFLEGYIIADIAKFPEVPYWIVPRHAVKAWWDDGRLGATTKISRQRTLELLDNLRILKENDCIYDETNTTGDLRIPQEKHPRGGVSQHRPARQAIQRHAPRAH